jgi:hypothetical protein
VNVAVVVILAVLVYAAACWLFPVGRHRRCHGTGRIYQPFSKTKWRRCGGCGGKGEAVRLGRAVFDWFLGSGE